jgi:membrane protease YdiL (CAAX protease family)
LKTKYIYVSSLLACLLLYYVEQVLAVDYLLKTITKVILFTAIPWWYYQLNKGQRLRTRKEEKNGRAVLGSTKLGLLLGIVAGTIILLTYSLLQGALNLPAIALELQEKAKVTPTNFLLVGLYITFGNSFLEEFFFRGYIFLSLYRLGQRSLAYIWSSLLFSLYHLAIFRTWFSPWLIGLALLGLLCVGFVFNWMDTRNNNWLNSWLTHILADAAIMLIGLRMFGMI